MSCAGCWQLAMPTIEFELLLQSKYDQLKKKRVSAVAFGGCSRQRLGRSSWMRSHVLQSALPQRRPPNGAVWVDAPPPPPLNLINGAGG